MTELSRAQKLALLPKEEQLKVLNEIAPTDNDKQLLLKSWGFWARPSQIEPFDKEYKLLLYMAGRGYGKTITSSQWVLHKARQNPGCIIGIIGQTVNDVRNVMIDNSPSSIIKQAPIDFIPEYFPTKRQLLFPNGSIAFTFSGDSPDSLRGFNLAFASVDELIKFRYPDDTISNLLLSLRQGKNPQWICTTTPKPSSILKNLVTSKDTLLIKGKTTDNQSNLPDTFIKTLFDRYNGTRLYQQEVEGQLLDDIEGALWSYSDIEKSRIAPKDLPKTYEKVIISIDPAVTSKRKSDETGIIILGLHNAHAYILADYTGKYTPNELATKITNLSATYNTTTIILEKNQGGDFLNAVLQFSEKNNYTIIDVFSSKSKMARAESIYGFYEQNRVHHVGVFSELEEEMITFSKESNFSPDHLDAMVHGLINLLIHPTKSELLDNNFWNNI